MALYDITYKSTAGYGATPREGPVFRKLSDDVGMVFYEVTNSGLRARAYKIAADGTLTTGTMVSNGSWRNKFPTNAPEIISLGEYDGLLYAMLFYYDDDNGSNSRGLKMGLVSVDPSTLALTFIVIHQLVLPQTETREYKNHGNGVLISRVGSIAKVFAVSSNTSGASNVRGAYGHILEADLENHTLSTITTGRILGSGTSWSGTFSSCAKLNDTKMVLSASVNGSSTVWVATVDITSDVVSTINSLSVASGLSTPQGAEVAVSGKYIVLNYTDYTGASNVPTYYQLLTFDPSTYLLTLQGVAFQTGTISGASDGSTANVKKKINFIDNARFIARGGQNQINIFEINTTTDTINPTPISSFFTGGNESWRSGEYFGKGLFVAAFIDRNLGNAAHSYLIEVPPEFNPHISRRRLCK